ncbi:hypothetical protein [Nocardia asteroides]|uniref:hypothetical protein n=1 Tax=Nocardia asteroides TaxID=1824 RepID=UPI0033C72594
MTNTNTRRCFHREGSGCEFPGSPDFLAGGNDCGYVTQHHDSGNLIVILAPAVHTTPFRDGALSDDARRITMGSLTELMMAAIAGIGSAAEGDGLLAVFLGSVEAFFP